MPMVEPRGGDQPFQGTEAPADVRVNEEAPHRGEQHEQCRYQGSLHALRGADAQEVDWDQSAQADKSVVDRMGARADQEVDLLWGMVQSVEAP